MACQPENLFTLRVRKNQYPIFKQFIERNGLNRNDAVNMAIARLLEEENLDLDSKKAPA